MDMAFMMLAKNKGVRAFLETSAADNAFHD
jgi:hypothetical protein